MGIPVKADDGQATEQQWISLESTLCLENNEFENWECFYGKEGEDIFGVDISQIL